MASINVTFEVQDANDNAPEMKPILEINVPSSTRPNSKIGQIAALDPDQLLAGTIQYELLTNRDLIRVDKNTGKPIGLTKEFLRGSLSLEDA